MSERLEILVIGGTGFIGAPLVKRLTALGHSVTVFHRGSTSTDLPARELIGERVDLANLRPNADIVIDLILSSGRQARALMQTFHGIARSVIAASSIDVYRACEILHSGENLPLQPVPLTEDSDLRTGPAYPPEQVKMLRQVFSWLDEEYDKIPVEQAVLSDSVLPGTVLRLPMIYGPGDRLRRFQPILRRIDDHRPVILFEERVAAWRTPRGYVENVAAAIALAAVSAQAAGRIYNVAETPAYSELDWATHIARAAAWDGKFLVLPKDRLPAGLVPKGNTAQHWEADSSRIRQELGYRETVPLDEALRRTIEWERAQPPGPAPDYTAEDAALLSA